MKLIEKDSIQIFSNLKTNPTAPIIKGKGEARVIVWPEVGANERSFFLIKMDKGSCTKVLNHSSESVYYVKEGSGMVTETNIKTNSKIIVGSMVHVENGTSYSFKAGDDGLVLIGGPCPFDGNIFSK